MLVLTRHLNEAIKIGNGITIKILSIDSSNVKLGIDAPKDIQVLREEIFEKIKNENLNASKVQIKDVKNIAQMLKEKVKTQDLMNQDNTFLFIYDNDIKNDIVGEVCIEGNLTSVKFDLRKQDNINLNSIPSLFVINVQNVKALEKIFEGIVKSGIKQPILALNVIQDFYYPDNMKNKVYLCSSSSQKDEIKRQILNMLKLKVHSLKSSKTSVIVNNSPFSIVTEQSK
jgi:carbon storage regulator